MLTREPFAMSMAQVARLTDYQIVYVVFLPRDKDGRLQRRSDGQVPYHEMLRALWAARGEDVEAKWAEWLQQNPGYLAVYGGPNGEWHPQRS